MNEFIIKDTSECGYTRFLLWLSSESLVEHLRDIETSQSLANASGKMLIDQLFLTGNGDNRFVCCNFNDGKLDMSTVAVVNPPECFRQDTVNWLRENYSYVECSILTDDQRQKILNAIAF